MRDYNDLTHRGQFGRLAGLARAALRDYDLSPETRLTPLHHAENTTFRVGDAATGRRYCLRVHRPGYQTIEAIRSELQLLEGISRDGSVIVPRPVATRSGDLLTSAAADGIPGVPRTVVLFDWVEGRFLRRRLPPKTIARSGATLAHLQQLCAAFAPPPGFVRPRFDVPDFRGATLADSLDCARGIVSTSERDAIEQAYEKAAAIQAALGRSRSVYGLIHADFHRGNFLVAPGGAIAVIDFDDCGWGHYLSDIAAATADYADNPVRASLYDLFLQGYRRVRPLSIEEERMLPAFYQLRRTLLLQWVIERTDNPTLRDWLPQAVAKTFAGAQAFLA